MSSRRAVLFLTVMAATLVMVSRPGEAADPFVVNSTSDENDLDFPGGVSDGSANTKCDVNALNTVIECTFRAAIQEANATPASDTIDFGVPRRGVKTIEEGATGNGPLPAITRPVTVDGYTQRPYSEGNSAPCSKPNTKVLGTNAVLLVELDGSNLSSGSGLVLRASDSTIKGLVINRFGSTGIATSDSASGSKIEGNFIGTDPSGTLALGNRGVGVSAQSESNTVGGDTLAARNLISANTEVGVGAANGTGNIVTGNLIGTMRDGTAALGNREDGVESRSLTTVVGNTIAFNRRSGLDRIVLPAPSRISNSIHSNGQLGVDLAPVGVVNPNDEDPFGPNDDADTGANNGQNFPTVTRATTSRSTGRSVVGGSLNTTPRGNFTIQLFANPSADPSGFGEGKRLLRTLSVTTDASGHASFGIKASKLKGFISATATNDATGDTSEFSAAKKVVTKR